MSSSPVPPSSEKPAVRAIDLRKTYPSGKGKVHALDGITVDFYQGQWTAIMGASGSGKSTLMHCLAGLDTPNSGKAFIGNTEITRASDAKRTKLRRTRVGFVFQSFNLVPVLNVKENITLPMKMAWKKPDKQRLAEVTERLGIGDLLTRRPDQLSGGQQQRVAIARALLPSPDVVFADEPTGNLDSEAGEAVLELLGQSARDLGQTVVMVTHDALAAAHTDRVLVLADGQIAAEDTKPTADNLFRTVREVGKNAHAGAGTHAGSAQ